MENKTSIIDDLSWRVSLEIAIEHQKESYQVSFNLVEKSLNFFSGINTWLGYSEFQIIWGDEADFFWKKWTEYKINFLRSDVVGFYQSLDPNNREKLVNWYNKKMLSKN